MDLSPLAGVTGTPRLLRVLDGTVTYATSSNIFVHDGSVATSVFATTPTLAGIVDFRFTDSDTLYLADESSTNGGLYRSLRQANGLFGTPTLVGGSGGLRSLAFDGTTFYATSSATTNNNLLTINPITGARTTLASAGTNRAFRGVEVVPEPATMAAMALGLGALAARRRRRN